MSTIQPERAEAPLVLALDIGSSSLRTLLFDRLGRAVAGSEARHPFAIESSPEGAAEADATQLLLRLFECIDGTLASVGPLAEQIGGVASCTFVSNVVGVDAQGRACTPLYTYADTRAAPDAAALRAELDENAIHQRTGCRLHPSYLPARFRWLARTRPEELARAQRWVTLGELLELTLFGEAAASLSVASWSGLLDRHRLVWDEPLLELLPLSQAELSPLSDVSLPRSGLRGEFAARWPALRQVPWFPAIGDGAAANIGSGCVSAGRVALTVGTTSALRAVVEGSVPTLPSGLWCYRVDARRALPGGALTEGGNLFAWMRATFQLPSPAEIESALPEREADGHGLTVLPFLSGERSPGWAGHARATIDGLTLATTPMDILQAGLEAICYRIALVYGMIRTLLPDEPQIIASGGALENSPAWQQMMADVLGCPVALSLSEEVSARGVALLALEAMGAAEGLASFPHPVSEARQPRAERHERYRAAVQRQQQLYDKLVAQSGAP